MSLTATVGTEGNSSGMRSARMNLLVALLIMLVSKALSLFGLPVGRACKNFD